MTRNRVVVRIAAIVGGVATALLLAELGLRLAGFRWELAVTVIQRTAPNRDTVLESYHSDPDLFWAPNGYEERVLRAAAEHARIVFFGDSCTEFGQYPDRLVAGASEWFQNGRPIPWAKLASAGWTTFQGRRALARDGAMVRPRVATFYFGWNDHWLSIGLPDAEIAELLARPLFRWRQLRVAQLGAASVVAWRARGRGDQVRVPLDDFRVNLRAMVASARAIGAAPMLLTAPTSHRRGREPESLRGRWILDLAQLVPMHRAYADAVRDVARSERVPLCDLAAGFESFSDDRLREELFLADGIHLKPDGDRELARLLAQCLEGEGLLALLLDADARHPSGGGTEPPGGS